MDPRCPCRLRQLLKGRQHHVLNPELVPHIFEHEHTRQWWKLATEDEMVWLHSRRSDQFHSVLCFCGEKMILKIVGKATKIAEIVDSACPNETNHLSQRDTPTWVIFFASDQPPLLWASGRILVEDLENSTQAHEHLRIRQTHTTTYIYIIL